MPMTREGLKTWAEIEAGLRAAGYPGPYDEASMLAAFERAGGGAETPGYRPPAGGLGGLADAAAQGNREQFAAQQRAWFIQTYGYDPGPMYGYGQGAQPGTYTTVNGPKTVDQMRQELRTAGYPNWEQADEQEIAGVYGSTSGGPVTKGGTGGDSPEAINRGFAQAIKDTYRAVAAHKGVMSLSADDPDLVNAVAARTRLPPEQARRILQAGKDHYLATGQEITDADLQQLVNQVMPFGENPSLPARQFERQGGRDAEDDQRWRRSFGEGQYQFDAGQYSDLAQTLISASAQMRGPRDYFKYQQMLGDGRDVMAQLSGDTPLRAFGMSGEPEPARVTDVLDGLGLRFPDREDDYFDQMRSGARIGPRVDALSPQERGTGMAATRRSRTPAGAR